MDAARIGVHVTPRSARDGILGWRGGDVSGRVTAPSEGGKANAAAYRVLTSAFGVPKSALTVARGHASRHKQVEVRGISEREVHERPGSPDELLS